jgi:hypothetical protein
VYGQISYLYQIPVAPDTIPDGIMDHTAMAKTLLSGKFTVPDGLVYSTVVGLVPTYMYA